MMVPVEKKTAVAENDKFERGLSKYWRKAYRLACAGATVPAVVDEIVTSVRQTLKDEASCTGIAELFVVLQEVLNRPPAVGQYSIFPDWDVRSEYLDVRLEQVCKDYDSNPFMRVAADAAAAVFESLSSAEADAQAVRDSMAETVTARLVAHRFTSRACDGLMEKCGRTVEQQREWEAEVEETLRPQARRLFNPIFREGRMSKRSPTRLHHRVRFTLDKLLAPLPGTIEHSDD